MKKIILAAVVLAVLYAVASPFVVIGQIAKAFITDNNDKVASYVDFEKVQENVKSRMNAKQSEKLGNGESNNPFALIGASIASAFTNGFVETVVTPAGLRSLIASYSAADALADKPSGKTISDIFKQASFAYLSPMSFSLTIHKKESEESLVLIFTRVGISWKMTDIVLP